ncbi:hypothetical protein [Acutalibacter muris]|nr:hypothetical protein [Acutalibacter muris]
MQSGRNSGKRTNKRTTENKDEQGGSTVETAAPTLFAVMGSTSSMGLSA